MSTDSPPLIPGPAPTPLTPTPLTPTPLTGTPFPGVGAARRRRLERAVAPVLLVLALVCSNGVLVAAPWLLSSAPLLLLTLRPGPESLLLAGAQAPFVAALLLGSATRILIDTSYFLVARHHGTRVAALVRPGRGLLGVVDGMRTRRGLLALSTVYSGTPVVIALGLGSCRLRHFLACSATGTVASTAGYLAAAHGLAAQFGAVVSWIEDHRLLVAAPVAVLALLGVGRLLLRLRSTVRTGAR
ncbi:hypothetical protein [Allostreptomyces psammosilenae]|uniref:Uncharacterized protein n=1 Tax=Allostreptomyces psammosilenae TaxID=1892865 RepID=A0A852ZYN8_9ACTN|nr:hypothetical protein [Allostreptomyces psammosilenae]NYI07269.1 hypothetical protein [Allostreptomyces psammosilenae]